MRERPVCNYKRLRATDGGGGSGGGEFDRVLIYIYGGFSATFFTISANLGNIELRKNV